MKALITGAGGQLGKALVACAPTGWECLALDRAALDLADARAVEARIAAEAPDMVLNAAAYTAVDRAQSEPDIAKAVNATAVGAMAGALTRTGGRLVHVSTDFVFDGASSRAYRPDHARHPLSVYGETKALGEDAAGPDALVVRTSWVYAAGGGNFVRTMLRLMRERDSLGVVADQVGAPTWAPGLARALWHLGDGGASGIFHYSDLGAASWYDFAVAIQEEALALGLLTHAIPVNAIFSEQYPTPATRPSFSLMDTRETYKALGWPGVHWRQNLRLMLKEEKALG